MFAPKQSLGNEVIIQRIWQFMLPRRIMETNIKHQQYNYVHLKKVMFSRQSCRALSPSQLKLAQSITRQGQANTLTSFRCYSNQRQFLDLDL